MKLYWNRGDYDWQPERYKYSVEQMMLTLFPGERPEYPEEPAGAGEDWARFAVTPGEKWVTVIAQVAREGRQAQGRARFPREKLDEPAEKVYHTVQHGLKMAFYRAGVTLLGQEPPWGALTGVRPVKLPTRAMLAGATPRQAQRELERDFRVSPVRASLAVDCAKASLAVDREVRDDQVSVYIGVPFCPTRCAYCSFVSADVGRTLKLVEPYLAGVLREIAVTGESLRRAGKTVHSLYVGGGTPTTLSASQLSQLLEAVHRDLPVEHCVEYTVEAGRPDTIDREKLLALREAGISRISINPQTLEDPVLQAIGRRHSAQDILDASALAREVGFESINMDLIAGLPRDSFEGFCRSLNGVLELAPENITVHTLALKKGSRLMEQGGALPSGEETARMLDYSLERLSGKGYLPYYLYRQKYMSGSLENVGWCLSGQESVYNIVMMEELQTVVSIGGGGVTKLVDRAAGTIVRQPNPKYPHDYLAALDRVLAQKEELAACFLPTHN